MSKTDGTFVGLVKSSMGRGKGKFKVSDDQTAEDDSKFLEEMYEGKDQSIESRKNNAQKFVNSFYNIVTDFYESGWGQSFHFAPRGKNESFRESIIRHEHYIALKLNIQPTDKVLDVGCGIGGPMRNIQQFTGADITGVTINEYQVNRGNEINDSMGFTDCRLKQGDFCKLEKFADNSFDKIFAIEATCHAPDRCAVYDQVYRVLKPGGVFASYEWVLNSDKFDGKNEDHLRIKHEVEYGNALPDLVTDKSVVASFKKSGFEVVEATDLDDDTRKKGQTAWYCTLESRYSLETIQHTYFATLFTRGLCWFLETASLAPKGTFRAHEILNIAKYGLVDAGRTQIFTPMFLVIGKKPEKK